jgi:hypothetical protein
LSVLNPGGRDQEQHFDKPAVPDSTSHAPVNFHAYAACTGGSFFRDTDRTIAAGQPVLLLLKPTFRESERALAELKAAGLKVGRFAQGNGLHQIADQLREHAQMQRIFRIVAAADGYLAPTAEAAEIVRTMRQNPETVAFIPTPYPLPDPEWDFSRRWSIATAFSSARASSRSCRGITRRRCSQRGR